MTFIVTIILTIVCTVGYTFYLFQIYKDGDEEVLDGIPRPLRWIYLVGYAVSCVYITTLILHWGLFVPGFISWALNLTLYLLDWSVMRFIYQVISDLIYTPILVMTLALPCILPNFRSDNRFTYFFRLITLGSMLPVHFYSINFFEAGDIINWTDRFIYNLALVFATYYVYTQAREDYLDGRDGTKKKEFMQILDLMWDRVKGLFHKG